MAPFSRFSLSRRNFMAALAFGTGSLLLKDYVAPLSAIADSSTPTDAIETYHIFVPDKVAQWGGKESLLLRSGEYISVDIPYHALEGTQVPVNVKNQYGKDIQVTIHTIYDHVSPVSQQRSMEYRVYDEIYNTEFLEPASTDKCKTLFQQLKKGLYITDCPSLDLLDYVIFTSNKIDENYQNRYQIARANSDLLGMQQVLEKSLAASSLSDNDKKQIRSAFAYVRAGEPIPDFKALSDLDAIIIGSNLPSSIKKSYSLASANSRALTVDFIIVNLIQNSPNLYPGLKQEYLAAYQQIRDGQEVTHKYILTALDIFIEDSKIPTTAKVIYALARKQDVDSEGNNIGELVGQANGLLSDARELKKELQKAQGRGAAFVPQTTKVLSMIGAETATGVSFSTLSGAAATNATLAFLGGGSVASGGLGMLGGLAVATGGAALLGAAGLLSIALIAEMDNQDRLNLGIAVGSGTLAGVASVLAAWTAASALGVTGTLSGAAAITAMISALGGLSVVTGGAALVASGVAFLIWSFLQSGKKRDQGVLKQLEARSYTLIDDPQPNSLGELFKNKFDKKFYADRSFAVSSIPLEKLSNALSSWLAIRSNETVLAFLDTSFWNDGKNGVAFTQERVMWKDNVLTYQELGQLIKSGAGGALADQKYRSNLSKLLDLSQLVSDEQKRSWVALLEEVGQKYSAV